jgi:hypothetical protein
MKQHNEVKPMTNDYIITVRPKVYIEYTIEAESEEEAWTKFHNNEYVAKEEGFIGFDWKPATIEIGANHE